jgi:dCTP deaminase
MILSDKTIKEMLASGELVLEPMTMDQIQPASVDIRISNHFMKIDENAMECMNLNQPIKYIEFEADEVIIPPHSFLLATTMEYMKLPNDVTIFVEGRSSIGRMGLFIQNAGWVDPGFEGEITLELYNANRLPIKIQAGRRVGQYVFAKMDHPADNPYTGKYQGQRKTIGSRIFDDHENTEKK